MTTPPVTTVPQITSDPVPQPVMTKAEEIKSTGLKATLPRIKILEVFQSAQQRHLAAEDIFKILLAEGAEIGLATIYRVLLQFEQAGILVRNHFESGKSVFELNEGQHHDHLVCLDCGHVEEFYDADIEARQRAIAQERGYLLQEHSLALYARCRRSPCSHRLNFLRDSEDLTIKTPDPLAP
jgi:Fur family ferric uptake transcriptional regulator